MKEHIEFQDLCHSIYKEFLDHRDDIIKSNDLNPDEYDQAASVFMRGCVLGDTHGKGFDGLLSQLALISSAKKAFAFVTYKRISRMGKEKAKDIESTIKKKLTPNKPSSNKRTTPLSKFWKKA